MLMLFTASVILSSSDAFATVGTAFRTSTPKTNLKMGLFENIPAMMNNDVSATFSTLSHLALDVGTAVISPQHTAGLRLIESIGQMFSLLSYCSSNQCIQSDELMYQALKMTFSFFLLVKTTIPVMKSSLNHIINTDNCPLSSRDKQAYEDLFEPIGLSWLHYNTLKHNGALEWINLNSNDKLNLPSYIYDTNKRPTLKDLTRRVLENEIYWLQEGSANIENASNLVFASNVFESASNERSIIAGGNGATILKINSHKISKLLENDTKLESCMQSLVFIGACNKMNQPFYDINVAKI